MSGPAFSQLSTKTYLAAGNAGAQRIIAHADFFVHIRICKVVLSARHGADKDGN